MSLHTLIVLNAIVDLGVVLAVAAIMLVPFTLNRRTEQATVYEFSAPLSEDLAA